MSTVANLTFQQNLNLFTDSLHLFSHRHPPSSFPLTAMLLLLTVSLSHSQGLARKEDIPYIKCQVCEILAKQLHQQVKIKQAEIAPKKISEYEIIKITDNVCNLKKVEVDWILCIDIVEKEDRLELVEHDSEGQCNSKCKTIERACQEVIGYSDANVAEYLYTWKPDADLLYKYFCKDLTKACNTKPPPVLKWWRAKKTSSKKGTKGAKSELQQVTKAHTASL
ncbi:hypothetical protein HN51_027635 [Arachis hypogaea]